MTVYVCLHCEYRFDTEKGDPAYNRRRIKFLLQLLFSNTFFKTFLLNPTNLFFTTYQKYEKATKHIFKMKNNTKYQWTKEH